MGLCENKFSMAPMSTPTHTNVHVPIGDVEQTWSHFMNNARASGNLPVCTNGASYGGGASLLQLWPCSILPQTDCSNLLQSQDSALTYLQLKAAAAQLRAAAQQVEASLPRHDNASPP